MSLNTSTQHHVHVMTLHSARPVTQHRHTASRALHGTRRVTQHKHTPSRALHSTRRVTRHRHTASRACNDTPQYTPCHTTHTTQHHVHSTADAVSLITHTAHHHVSAATPGPQQYGVQPLTLNINSGTQSQTAITHRQRSNQQRACIAAYSIESAQQTMRFLFEMTLREPAN